MRLERFLSPRSRRALALPQRRYEIRVDFVAGHDPIRKAVLESGSVIAMEGPEAEGTMEKILEAVRSGKAICEAPKGTKKYRPGKPDR